MRNRLLDQIRFILEIDRLKSILRQTVLVDESRYENSAGHSWHLAVMAILLHEYAAESVDLLRVVKMVLVHDIVEIDAGDTFCYDEAANSDKLAREQAAADRIFNLLPDPQSAELRSLWDEFESGESSEARFARALDRMQPVLLNLAIEGGSWRRHGISARQVVERNSPIGDGAPELWLYVEEQIREAVANGVLVE